jgi:hypothetical protein
MRIPILNTDLDAGILKTVFSLEAMFAAIFYFIYANQLALVR